MPKYFVKRWKKKGYDSDLLYKKPEKLGQGKMRTWIEKWRKKGYDIGSISERGYKKNG